MKVLGSPLGDSSPPEMAAIQPILEQPVHLHRQLANFICNMSSTSAPHGALSLLHISECAVISAAYMWLVPQLSKPVALMKLVRAPAEHIFRVATNYADHNHPGYQTFSMRLSLPIRM